jgi:hypothetical protein
MPVDPESTTSRGLQSVFKPKDDKNAEPEVYLGARLGKVSVNGHECWTMSAEKEVSPFVKNMEEMPSKKGLRLPSKC